MMKEFVAKDNSYFQSTSNTFQSLYVKLFKSQSAITVVILISLIVLFVTTINRKLFVKSTFCLCSTGRQIKMKYESI